MRRLFEECRSARSFVLRRRVGSRMAWKDSSESGECFHVGLVRFVAVFWKIRTVLCFGMRSGGFTARHVWVCFAFSSFLFRSVGWKFLRSAAVSFLLLRRSICFAGNLLFCLSFCVVLVRGNRRDAGVVWFLCEFEYFCIFSVSSSRMSTKGALR